MSGDKEAEGGYVHAKSDKGDCRFEGAVEYLGVEEEGDEHGKDRKLVSEDIEECAEGVAPPLPTMRMINDIFPQTLSCNTHTTSTSRSRWIFRLE